MPNERFGDPGINSPIVLLMGPTASGKSEVAIDLAKRIPAEIISVDSVMVYRGMDIGTAKPRTEHMHEVPHHLINIMDPDEIFSAGQFRERALGLIREIFGRKRIPLLVGGTMMYFNTLLVGLANLPSADPAVRKQIEEEARIMGWNGLHDQLAAVDPAASKRIHPNDPQRIQRALEIIRVSGHTLTELYAAERSKSLTNSTIRFIIEPKDRSLLHARIEKRFEKMIKSGLIGEVERLRNQFDLNKRMPSVRAVGYRQVWDYLDGLFDERAMKEKAVYATRQLARRQLTWLRRDASALRFDFGYRQNTEKMVKQLEGRLDLGYNHIKS